MFLDYKKANILKCPDFLTSRNFRPLCQYILFFIGPAAISIASPIGSLWQITEMYALLHKHQNHPIAVTPTIGYTISSLVCIKHTEPLKQFLLDKHIFGQSCQDAMLYQAPQWYRGSWLNFLPDILYIITEILLKGPNQVEHHLLEILSDAGMSPNKNITT